MYTHIPISIICLFTIDKLTKIHNQNLGYYLLHFIADITITITTATEAWDVYSNPTKFFHQAWSTSFGQAFLITLFFYHLLMFDQIGAFDKVHHLTTLIFGLIPSYFLIQDKGLNAIVFTLNGPLGAINSIMFYFYIQKKITPYVHSLISLVLFVWIRVPLIMILLYEWCRSISRGQSNVMGIITIIVAVINAIMLAHFTVIRFYKKHVQKEQQQKHNRIMKQQKKQNYQIIVQKKQ